MYCLVLFAILLGSQSHAQSDDLFEPALRRSDLFTFKNGRVSPTPRAQNRYAVGQKDQLVTLGPIGKPALHTNSVQFLEDKVGEDTVYRLVEYDYNPDMKSTNVSATSFYKDGVRSRTACLSLSGLPETGFFGGNLQCVTATRLYCGHFLDRLKKTKIGGREFSSDTLDTYSKECSEFALALSSALNPVDLKGNQAAQKEYDRVVDQDVTAISHLLKKTKGAESSTLFSWDGKQTSKADTAGLDQRATKLKEAGSHIVLASRLVQLCAETHFEPPPSNFKSGSRGRGGSAGAGVQ